MTVPEEHSLYTWYLIWTRRVKRVGGLVSLSLFLFLDQRIIQLGPFFNYFLHLRTASLWMYLFCMRELYLCTLWAPLRPSFALKWLSGGKCFMVVENDSFLHVKSQKIVPAFQIKLLNDGGRGGCRVDQCPSAQETTRSVAVTPTTASCLLFNYTDIIWCKCPHSPMCLRNGLSIWFGARVTWYSSAAIMHLYWLHLLFEHNTDKQETAKYWNYETRESHAP